jgi:hypothetical protein
MWLQCKAKTADITVQANTECRAGGYLANQLLHDRT